MLISSYEEESRTTHASSSGLKSSISPFDNLISWARYLTKTVFFKLLPRPTNEICPEIFSSKIQSTPKSIPYPLPKVKSGFIIFCSYEIVILSVLVRISPENESR